MRYIVCFIVFLIFGVSNLSAQSSVTHEDPGVTRLMEKYKAQNDARTFVKGFRIQVASTTDRAKIQQQAGSFSYHFPEMKADWINEAPYYKLKSGAFETKLECTYILKRIQEHFPGAYMIVDNRIPISQVRDSQNH